LFSFCEVVVSAPCDNDAVLTDARDRNILTSTNDGRDRKAGDAIRRRCIEDVMREFPFAGYMQPMRDAYDAITTNCLRLLPVGSRILDFGAGPCEKAAILARLGYHCTAVDDLSDDWHQLADNRNKICSFAKAQKVELWIATRVPLGLPKGSFGMVMIHDVLEHFASSPRELLLGLIHLLQPNGYLYVTVPNAVNLRKRLLVLSGRTNYPRYGAYFWSGDVWRGHKREYVKDDLAQLCTYLGLGLVLLKGQHHRMRALPSWCRALYRRSFGQIDSLRDTLALIAQKPADWKPCEITAGQYRQIQQRETLYQFA
jgi:SAM-dependent methyltransferase